MLEEFETISELLRHFYGHIEYFCRKRDLSKVPMTYTEMSLGRIQNSLEEHLKLLQNRRKELLQSNVKSDTIGNYILNMCQLLIST
jgi:hypothetical protein